MQKIPTVYGGRNGAHLEKSASIWRVQSSSQSTHINAHDSGLPEKCLQLFLTAAHSIHNIRKHVCVWLVLCDSKRKGHSPPPLYSYSNLRYGWSLTTMNLSVKFIVVETHSAMCVGFNDKRIRTIQHSEFVELPSSDCLITTANWINNRCNCCCCLCNCRGWCRKWRWWWLPPPMVDDCCGCCSCCIFA